MKLKKVISLEGQIEALTGLHIGVSSDIIEIGGIDSPVIKHPLKNEPYIPGSSLKGKMRSLLEWYLGKVEVEINNGKAKGNVCSCGKKECQICRIFGVSSNNNNGIGPARLVVRDAFLNKDWKNKAQENNFLLTEYKTENNIDRITAKANPRTMERVTPGALFDFNIIYKVFELNDDISDEEYFDYVLGALKLVEYDYLGGGGSRGSGKIRFINLVKIDSDTNTRTSIDLPDRAKLKEHIDKAKEKIQA